MVVESSPLQRKKEVIITDNSNKNTIKAQCFAWRLLAELRTLEPCAGALQTLAIDGEVALGLEDDGEFVPLLLLSVPTPKWNKMMLSIAEEGFWKPTFHKGTPKMLAELLAVQFRDVWAIPLAMVGWHPALSPSQKG